MNGMWKCLAVMVFWAAVSLVVSGCGTQSVPVDPTPFRQAIGEYLESKNMAMAIKEIKAGPEVDGETARLTASLSHKDLGGPSVTWTFHFKKQGSKWTVLRHDD